MPYIHWWDWWTQTLIFRVLQEASSDWFVACSLRRFFLLLEVPIMITNHLLLLPSKRRISRHELWLEGESGLHIFFHVARVKMWEYRTWRLLSFSNLTRHFSILPKWLVKGVVFERDYWKCSDSNALVPSLFFFFFYKFVNQPWIRYWSKSDIEEILDL